MTKLRNIDAVVNAMIANPNATTYDFVAGRDDQGEYIEKRSAIASKFRQWRGKHVNATGTDAKARYNRDKVVLSNFLVAKTIKKFVSEAAPTNPLALFGSKTSSVLLTSHKAAAGTYFKARFADGHERSSTALAHYEIMVRAMHSGRRPKIENAASQPAVYSSVSERWQIRGEGDADSNAGSCASELNRLGRGNAPYIWLGNAEREDIEKENEDLNGAVARGPQVPLKPGRNSPPSPSVDSTYGKTPDDLYAFIYEQANNISVLKDNRKSLTNPGERAQAESFIAGAYARIGAATTEFINRRFGTIPKDHAQLEAFIGNLDVLGRQYEQKIADIRQTISTLNEEDDAVLLETHRTILAQVINADSYLGTIRKTAIDDRIRLEGAARRAAEPARRAPPPAPPARPAPLEQSLRPRHNPADTQIGRAEDANPFGKLAGARELNRLLEESKHRIGQEPGSEALQAVNILVSELASRLQTKAAIRLFVDEIADTETNVTPLTPPSTPLNALVRNYETRLFPAFLGAKRTLADLNQEIASRLEVNAKLVGNLQGDPVVPGKPWQAGLNVHLGDKAIRVPCGIQPDGTFLLYDKTSKNILRYELGPAFAAQGVALHLYLRELARETNGVRREFTKGIQNALAPSNALGDTDTYLAAYAANKSIGGYPRNVPASIISTVDDRREEEDRFVATNYTYDSANGLTKKNLEAFASVGVLHRTTKEEIEVGFSIAARAAFYKVVDAKALEFGREITQAQIKKIAVDLSQDYVDELEILRDELRIAELRLETARRVVANKRAGSDEEAIYGELESATYDHTLISAKIKFCGERQAYAIQLSEIPRTFWNRYE